LLACETEKLSTLRKNKHFTLKIEIIYQLPNCFEVTELAIPGIETLNTLVTNLDDVADRRYFESDTVMILTAAF